MQPTEKRVAIISFDGLSAAQFERLLPQMPAVQSLLGDGHLTELDAAPFSDAQPIWAEILTGEPWYRNGCVGYAAPLRSLTELKLFSESDLNVKQQLLPEVAEGVRNIVINIPLLEPREHERKWMADGSSPSLTTVSPNSLMTNEPFKSYKPRPLISMGKAMAEPLAASTFLGAESNRAACAQTLSNESNWRMFMYRASIFDQLTHLFGPTFLDHTNLKVSAGLKELLVKLDSMLYQTMSRCDKVLVLSAFSHTACQEMLGLNDLFQNFGLLERNSGVSKENSLRKQAFALINSEDATPLVSASNQISPAQTICASPIRGAVYVNSIDRFADGIVSSSDLEERENQVFNLLKEETERFSSTACLFRNKASIRQAPNFIVDIAGVDLVDSLSCIRRSYDLPHSVHNSRGFVWLKATNSKPVKAVELLGLIAELD